MNMEGQPELETLRIAVRQLAESANRQGDLKPGGWELANPAEAVRAHRKIQESRPAEYTREVPLSGVATGHGFRLEVEGRADGVFEHGNRAVVEEIKTTRHDLSDDRIFDNAVHWAQARIYSYLLWNGRDLERVETQLTYYQLDTQEERSTRRTWEIHELRTFFEAISNHYLRLCRERLEWLELRNDSARSLEFPFPHFRAGQREVAVAVYQVVRDGGQLLVQAPTGIGKTVAAIFPSIKAMGEGHLRRMFFLTARGTGQRVALSALEDLRSRGLRIRALQLTARDKVCFCDPAACSAAECEFARGFYDRLEEGIKNLLREELLSREVIEGVAKRHRLCPFELSLELISFADCVICDYNYVFDPQVYLRRGDLDAQESVLYLVDEAHNLVDRAREMYSAAISKENLLEVRRQVQRLARNLSRSLNRANSWLLRRRQVCEEQGHTTTSVEKPVDLFPVLAQCLRDAEQLLAGRPDLSDAIRESVAGFYYALGHFLRTGEAYDERYRTTYQVAGTDLVVSLYCVDPSNRLRESLKRTRCAVFLSATLDPPDYFRSVLGCSETALELRVPSPFPPENFCALLMDRASTLYRKREDTLETIVQCLMAFVGRRSGNYLALLPLL